MTPESDPRQVTFRAPDFGAALLVREWGDVYAVYQFSSGETHFFNEVTAALLDCIRESPGCVEAIVARVADVLGVGRANAVADDFLEIFARLEELGLLERVNDNSSENAA